MTQMLTYPVVSVLTWYEVPRMDYDDFLYMMSFGFSLTCAWIIHDQIYDGRISMTLLGTCRGVEIDMPWMNWIT